jgi:NTE family protein
VKRALVLGGGGVVGIAWETGLLSGLADAGVDVRDADLVVGTSAGSMVGARIAAGFDPREPAPASAEGIPFPEGGPDLATLGRVFQRWTSAERVTPAFCAELGRLALAARTAPEERFIAATGGSLGLSGWPDRDLQVTAVDAETGHFRLFGKAEGVPVEAAVAASCAVPGMFPPVVLEGRRYVDGGVRSGTSADAALALEPDLVLVVAPVCARTAVFGALAERCLEEERKALSAAGARVVVVLPEDEEIAAFGDNLMDPSRAEAAREAGRARGRALARGPVGPWSG